MKNAHLLFSSIVLLPIAITYGISPDVQIPFGISFSIESVDLKNILRAIMGLYLAMIDWWILGVFNSKSWVAATMTNIFFMAGLGVGRLISVVIDGVPSMNFHIGMYAEFLIAIWGIYSWRKYDV